MGFLLHTRRQFPQEPRTIPVTFSEDVSPQELPKRLPTSSELVTDLPLTSSELVTNTFRIGYENTL